MVWGERRPQYKENLMVPTTIFDGGSVCVWEGLCYDCHTDLVVFINKTVMAVRYLSMVKDTMVLPFGVANRGDYYE